MEEKACNGLVISGPQLRRSIKMKRLGIHLHRIALGLPCRQSALEKFNSRELQRKRPLQNHSAGLLADARAVNHRILLLRNQRGLLNYLLRRDPPRSGNNLRVRQQIKRLPDIKHKDVLLPLQQIMQGFWLDAVLVQLSSVPQLPDSEYPEDQDDKPDHADRNQIHIHPPRTSCTIRLINPIERCFNLAPGDR